MANGTESTDSPSPSLKDQAKKLYLSVGGMIGEDSTIPKDQIEFITTVLTQEERFALNDEIRRNKILDTDPFTGLIEEVWALKTLGGAALPPEETMRDPVKLRAWVDRTSKLKEIVEHEFKAIRKKEEDDFQRKADDICKTFFLSDIGNAERLVYRYGKKIRYCAPFDEWYIWDGKRWKPDDSVEILALAKNTALWIGDEARRFADSDKQSLHFKWAGSCQHRTRISNMIALSQCDVSILPDQLDAKKNLLNCQNCTIDLNTFQVKEHTQADYLTKITRVEYDPDAKCPLWIAHLLKIFGNDLNKVIDFQRMAGYALLADNPEQVFFILHGGGANGKGVTTSVISYVIGEYARSISPETLMIQKNSCGGGAARADLVDMIGARLIITSESDQDHQLAEGFIKMATGEDEITMRGTYEKKPRHELLSGKVWLSTNHLPIIKGTDHAIWRRVWRVPFSVTIEEKDRDVKMKEKLIEEAPGILAWMVEGLRIIQERDQGRLLMPEWVKDSTSQYQLKSDVIGTFLNEMTERKGEIPRSTLWRVFTDWCNESGDDPGTVKKFTESIRDLGFGEQRRKDGWVWLGLKEKAQTEAS